MQLVHVKFTGFALKFIFLVLLISCTFSLYFSLWSEYAFLSFLSYSMKIYCCVLYTEEA